MTQAIVGEKHNAEILSIYQNISCSYVCFFGHALMGNPGSTSKDFTRILPIAILLYLHSRLHSVQSFAVKANLFKIIIDQFL
jgi:hypothetical protein